MMTLDGYIRVSRIGGRKGDGYIAPDVQRERIQAYAAELGATIAEWHDDQDYSGGNTERPGFQAVLERIHNRHTGGVVVASIDRFARSTADGAATVRTILEAGAIFASCNERIDPKTPTGQYMLNSFFNNAELQLNMLKASWVVAKDRAVKRGAHIGRTPFGYLRGPKGADGSGVLQPHPEQAPAVARAFEARRDGTTYTDVARLLDGIAPKATHWTVVDVKRMLQNRVFLGEVRYGEAVNRNAHPAIVDPGLFAVVQATITAGRAKVADSPFLLSGLVRCAHCRYAMGGFSRGGSKRDTPVYRCISRGNRCDHRPLVTAAPLEEYVTSIWREAMRAEDGRTADEPTEPIDAAALEAEAAALWAEYDSYNADVALKLRIGAERWQKGADARLEAAEAAEAKRAAAQPRALIAGKEFNPDTEDRDEIRAEMPSLVKYVFVRSGRRPIDQRALVVLDDGPDFDTPRRGVPGPFSALPWADDEGPSVLAG